MENVRGMLPYAEQVVNDFKNINIEKKKNKKYFYDIAYKVLISDDFGVAQKDKDFFIAVRNDIVKKKKITAAKNIY
ncbi:MAG: DNA cytosine methyltransferase [Ignavibacteria bacterium]|nr:DNA cytosine methyltransferase [Ignavibacteria bacterium]